MNLSKERKTMQRIIVFFYHLERYNDIWRLAVMVILVITQTLLLKLLQFCSGQIFFGCWKIRSIVGTSRERETPIGMGKGFPRH